MKIILLIFTISLLSTVTLPFNHNSLQAQSNFLAISGEIKHVDENKIPEELQVDLVVINESGEQSRQSTIAKNGYYLFFISHGNHDVYFIETTYQNIKYISDYYNAAAEINQTITIDVAIFDKNEKVPAIENIVTKFTLSKIDYSQKTITFIREDIIRNTENWTFFFDDEITATYNMYLLTNTISAVGNLGNDLFLQDDNYLNINMPILPGINTISTIHTVALADDDTYNFIYNSNYDTNVLEINIPTRFSKEIIPIKGFQKKGEKFFEKEKMQVFQAENIAKKTETKLLIKQIFREKNFFLAQNNIFAIISIIISSVIFSLLIIKVREKNA